MPQRERDEERDEEQSCRETRLFSFHLDCSRMTNKAKQIHNYCSDVKKTKKNVLYNVPPLSLVTMAGPVAAVLFNEILTANCKVLCRFCFHCTLLE